MKDLTKPTPDETRRQRRRRRWILALAVPGYISFFVIALMAWAPSDLPEWTLVVVLPVGVAGVLSHIFAPVLFLIDLWVLFRDPWRKQRTRRERWGLRLFAIGSLPAWVISLGIADAYHVWR